MTTDPRPIEVGFQPDAVWAARCWHCPNQYVLDADGYTQDEASHRMSGMGWHAVCYGNPADPDSSYTTHICTDCWGEGVR